MDNLINEIRSMNDRARYNRNGTPLLTGESMIAMSRLYVLLPDILKHLEQGLDKHSVE